MPVVTAYTRNIKCQFPHSPAATPAITGPNVDDIALINCPNVNILVTLSFDTTSNRSGFNETCKIVFPMPSKANAINTDTNE